MRLRVKHLGIESGGKPVVTLSTEDAEELGVRGGERVRLIYDAQELIAIANLVTKSVPKGIVGVYDEISNILGAKADQQLEIEAAGFPESLNFIQNKLKRRKLNYGEILQILKDVITGNLSEAEIAAFVTALDQQGLDLDEAASLTMAMVETGGQLRINRRPICDKHSIGGVPGDKSTLLIVPIISAVGLTIPKTSSRAITSAAGTADRAETIMPVRLSIDEMTKVVERTNGCIVWGGSLELAPADDMFVQVEYPLSIDPLLLPSIMAKKKAVGADFLALDVPAGRGTKVKTIGDADLLAKDFMELSKRLGIKTQCLVSFGEQPVGYAIGPALEAQEAMKVLKGANVPDLVDKVAHLCGLLFGMSGKGNEDLALRILRSGKAEKKMREIIYQQGGDPEIDPDEIEVGPHTLEVTTDDKGSLLWYDNHLLVAIARIAGAPKDKRAGITLHRKIGARVKKGDRIMTIYAEKTSKIHNVERILSEVKPYGIGHAREMLIHKILEVPEPKKSFILER